jgi:hypothetical protein
MLTAVGEEYLCYSESNTGQYSPLIGIARYDGTLGFRDFIKDDLTRISDPEIFPGGWLFRKSISSSAGSWIKRFTILRGNCLFLFHNPQNEKPIGIIPLEGTKIVCPENDEKTFDEAAAIRSFKANDGYEFDIRHASRPTVRLYALSSLERSEWITVCQKRTEVIYGANNAETAQDLARLLPSKSNISVTGTKLAGVSLAPSDSQQHPISSLSPVSPLRSPMLTMGGTGMMNPYLPPPLYDGERGRNSGIGRDGGDLGDVESVLQGTLGSPASTYYSGYNNQNASNDVFQNSGSSINSLYNMSASMSSMGMMPPPPPQPGPPPPLSETPEFSAAIGSFAMQQQIHGGGRASQMSHLSPPPFGTSSYHQQQNQQHQHQPQVTPSKDNNKFAINKIKRSIIEAKFANLENNLNKIVNEQKEARNRENVYRSKITSKEVLQDARNVEEKNPLYFAEIFRLMLYFYGEEITEDPQPDSKQQCPYAKGKEIEEMLLTVYQRYCDKETGFMSIEQFVEFMEDASILQSHAAHNDNDEPLDEYKDILDPVHLIRSLPKNIQSMASKVDEWKPMLGNYAGAAGGGGNQQLGLGGYQVQVTDQRHFQAQKVDKFVINFGQFYQLLLHITQIVYPELYQQDATVAFNKILLVSSSFVSFSSSSSFACLLVLFRKLFVRFIFGVKDITREVQRTR